MKQCLFKWFTALYLLLWIGCLQPDGFAERTLVRDFQGFRPIEQFIVNNCVVVVAEGGQLQPYSIKRTMSYVADSFIKIYIKDICVCAAPHQKFYSCTRNDWINANALQTAEQLLCGNGKTVSIRAIETMHKQQKMHTFSVETSHIFCVTPYEIIAHNVDPVISTGAVAALSVACPPAAIAVAVVEAVTFSVLGCVMYCAHRKTSKTAMKNDGCFSSNDVINQAKDGKTTIGCYHPMPDCPLVCDIQAGKETDTTKVIPYATPEVLRDKGCVIIPAGRVETSLHHATAKQSDCDEHKRYNGPWYNRTEDWLKEFKQKDKLERSIYVNQGKRVFKVLKDIEGCTGFKKGDYVVIDALHNDHLEVFDKYKEWKHVANFDGTKNDKKTEQGRTEPRKPLKKG